MLKEKIAENFPEIMEIFRNHGEVQGLNDRNLGDFTIALGKIFQLVDHKSVEYINDIACGYHMKRSLVDAGEYYQKVLQLESPGILTEKERESIIRYAPMIHIPESEFFSLKDVIAIHHPEKNIISYHFFWDDDYNFPDDYDPCDHEQIWVEYNDNTQEVEHIWTFFHSHLLTSGESVDEARLNGQRPIIRVQWGIHGSLPKGWENLFTSEGILIWQFMQENYNDLINGGRAKDHSIKKKWPRGFVGDFEAFITFDREIDTRVLLEEKQLIGKSKWCNAMIQQQFLSYNFAQNLNGQIVFNSQKWATKSDDRSERKCNDLWS